MLQGLFSDDPFVLLEEGKYSRHQIVSAAFRLSSDLPEAPVVMNLYTRRHEFLVVLLAVAFQNGVTILPPNTAENTVNGLLDEIESERKLIVGDQVADRNALASIDLETLMSADLVNETLLQPKLQTLTDAQIWLYTSGSTGKAKKVVKTWHQMMVLAAKAIARFELNENKTPGCVVATVPSQHMFGLETTIFWPLFSKLQVWSGRPLFAEDIKFAINLVHQPVWLVSTPLHLKKLAQFDTDWSVQNADFQDGSEGLKVLSATAPLDVELAKTVSRKMRARVFEVFGSTETASIASRETLVFEAWRLYEHNRLQKNDSTDGYDVIIQDLDERHPLQDKIQLLSPTEFSVLGRQSDLIKVAGKRASLADLNRILQNLPQVEDGVFWKPEDSERLQAFVVSDESSQAIRQQLAKSMDAVFLPRPVHFVERIPRNEMGKVPVHALLDLLNQAKGEVKG